MAKRFLRTGSIVIVALMALCGGGRDVWADDRYRPYYMTSTPVLDQTGQAAVPEPVRQVLENGAVMGRDTLPTTDTPPFPEEALALVDMDGVVVIEGAHVSGADAVGSGMRGGSSTGDAYGQTMKTYEEVRATSSPLSLETLSGIEGGLQTSNYHYREPSLDVSWSGFKGGLTLAATKKFEAGYFVTGDLRYAFGTVDYSGSGRRSGDWDNLWDVRLLGGFDVLGDDVAFSPFIGVGYRNLYNDGRGPTTQANTYGYRRNNDLLYVPVGVEARLRLDQRHRLAARFEYDRLIYGMQTSLLSDVSGYPDLYNVQHKGQAYRAELMWQTATWSVGPFASYWTIPNSTRNTACGTVYCATGFEPHNNTLEVGGQLRYRFYTAD